MDVYEARQVLIENKDAMVEFYLDVFEVLERVGGLTPDRVAEFVYQSQVSVLDTIIEFEDA